MERGEKEIVPATDAERERMAKAIERYVVKHGTSRFTDALMDFLYPYELGDINERVSIYLNK